MRESRAARITSKRGERAKPSMHRKMLEEFVKVVSADFDHARVKVTLLRLGSTLQGGLFERDSEATA